MSDFLSWGRYPRLPQKPHYCVWPDDVERHIQSIHQLGLHTMLAFGCGRSYGDSCLAESGHVLAMEKMDKLLSVDWKTGVVLAQAGLTLAELIKLALPQGWFLPVTPGTKFVTLGGAVANDVHGKNHHVMGTFGSHVLRLWVRRSDQTIIECSPFSNAEFFSATVSGLGLTGIILAVEIQLRPITSSQINQNTIRFGGLNEFFSLSKTYDSTHEYSVAWIDCLASGKQTGRGHFIMGNHAENNNLLLAKQSGKNMPFTPPMSLINKLSLKLFNTAYYYRQLKKNKSTLVGYDKFFYPLDGLQNWNRMYGRAGFQQYQCVVPMLDSAEVVREIIMRISKSGLGSFLAVLKLCGEKVSPGLLSFPMPGVSLALDFPQRDEANKQLFEYLDALVHEAGGRLYPAKDAQMSASNFQKAYPDWVKIEAMRDPQLMSHFWKRVTQ